MEARYLENAKILKALSDPKRLRIVDMLSCGELCACKILDAFSISQPTLSHDMRVLTEAGVVRSRREGRWTHYALAEDRLTQFYRELGGMLAPTEDCLCHGGQG